jgi:hypothetical protein
MQMLISAYAAILSQIASDDNSIDVGTFLTHNIKHTVHAVQRFHTEQMTLFGAIQVGVGNLYQPQRIFRIQ